IANTFLLTVATQFNSGIGGGGGGGFGGNSMGNFGGYRAGAGVWGDTGTSYGTGYGGAFQNLGVFGQTGGMGSTSALGSTPFGSSGMGTYSGSGFDTNKPQGYETFGPNYRGGQSGGFNSGLGDISGGRAPGGDMEGIVPATPGQGLEGLEDWYNLDDMYSVWW
ncbi:MAG: hypothetical protein WCP21_24305, partial [Armatimonadota bacterium]